LDSAKVFSACLEKKQETSIKEENEKEEEPEKKTGVSLVNQLNMVFYGVPVNRVY
jgi:hypothetical protein